MVFITDFCSQLKAIRSVLQLRQIFLEVSSIGYYIGGLTTSFDIFIILEGLVKCREAEPGDSTSFSSPPPPHLLRPLLLKGKHCLKLTAVNS
jgi:hypothetical protein